MKSEADELRQEIQSAREERRRGPYPEALRERLKSHVKRRWEAGESLEVVARELGVRRGTVDYWRGKWGERPGVGRQMRVVKVVAEERGGLVLRGPGGTYVEGLSLGDLAELWRQLG
jgi:hypothetical protein